MKIRANRLVAAGIGLISATLIASISISFAWYASGDILGVNPIVISFVGDKKIYASLVPENEQEEIDYQTNLIFNDEVDDKIYYPVSSMYSKEWLDNLATKPVFRTGYKNISIEDVDSFTKGEAITIDEDGYFSKELYLYSEYNVVVTLDAEKTAFLPDEKANKKTAEILGKNQEEIDLIYEDLNNVTKSLRMSVLIPDMEHEDRNQYQYYIVDPYKEEETYLCGPLNNHDPINEYYERYYQDDGDYEYYFGEYNDVNKIVYSSEPLEEDSQIEGRIHKFNSKHHRDTYVIDIEKSEENGFIRGVEKSIDMQEADITTDVGKQNGIRIKLDAFEKKKIVLSMYLEGWDLDNIGYCEKGQFTAEIQFKIGEEHF